MIDGIRIAGDICVSPDNIWKDFPFYRDIIIDIIESIGFNVTGDCSKEYPETGGFSLNIMLEESHVCIHTWPEKNFLSIDIHTCNYTKNNNAAAQDMFKLITGLFDIDMEKSKVTTLDGRE